MMSNSMSMPWSHRALPGRRAASRKDLPSRSSNRRALRGSIGLAMKSSRNSRGASSSPRMMETISASRTANVRSMAAAIVIISARSSAPCSVRASPMASIHRMNGPSMRSRIAADVPRRAQSRSMPSRIRSISSFVAGMTATSSMAAPMFSTFMIRPPWLSRIAVSASRIATSMHYASFARPAERFRPLVVEGRRARRFA